MCAGIALVEFVLGMAGYMMFKVARRLWQRTASSGPATGGSGSAATGGSVATGGGPATGGSSVATTTMATTSKDSDSLKRIESKLYNLQIVINV